MDKKTIHWILDVQDTALDDEKYMRLYEDYMVANDHLLALMKDLSGNQQTVIWEYIRISVAMYHRILEIASQK